MHIVCLHVCVCEGEREREKERERERAWVCFQKWVFLDCDLWHLCRIIAGKDWNRDTAACGLQEFGQLTQNIWFACPYQSLFFLMLLTVSRKKYFLQDMPKIVYNK